MQICRDNLHIFVKFKRISYKFCFKNQAGFLLKKEKSVYYIIFLYILYTIKVYRKLKKTSYFYNNNSII